MKTVNVYVSNQIFEDDGIHSHCEERTVEYQYDADTTLDKMITDLVGSGPLYTEHIVGRTVRYIIRNNKVEWEIQASDCTVDDYCQTYPDEQPKIVVAYNIGADDPGIFYLFIQIVTFLMSLEWCAEKFTKMRVKLFCKPLVGKDGRYIEERSFVSFILSRKEWRLDEFMQLCGFTDETLARGILYSYGFECNQGNVFEYSAVLANNNADQIRDAQMRSVEELEDE